MSGAAPSPFSPRAVLGLVLFGALAFVALLWAIGAGDPGGSTNDGGSHAGSNGLTGYAALAGYLERRGYAVRRARNEGALDDPGLLVLTPGQMADGAELDRIVAARRTVGPTLVITPKWLPMPTPPRTPGAKQGWTAIGGAAPPEWPGFLDDVAVGIAPMRAGGRTARWHGAGLSGELPVSESVLSGSGPRLVPLVTGTQDGRILAAYLADGGMYPALEDLASSTPPPGDDDTVYPVAIVFEPDLLDNYGMADRENALLADRLFAALTADSDAAVTFDLTQNGLGRSTNLLTLAFSPPFLAATLCLLLAALVVGWRAFLRFGPPLAAVRAIAFGKRALVGNAAGLVRRAGRLHLVTGPYADHVRERLAQALALPRGLDPVQADAAIDRALAARRPDSVPFSTLAARLRAARRPQDAVRAAQDLHAIERTLTR